MARMTNYVEEGLLPDLRPTIAEILEGLAMATAKPNWRRPYDEVLCRLSVLPLVSRPSSRQEDVQVTGAVSLALCVQSFLSGYLDGLEPCFAVSGHVVIHDRLPTIATAVAMTAWHPRALLRC